MQHTKLKRLVRALGIPQYAAVGILESLWHLTARESPSGDIGKLSNEDIAIQLDWREEPDVLIQALLASGWLDTSEKYRLIVHDWADHCMDPLRRGYPNGKRSRRWHRVREAGGELAAATRAFIFERDKRCLRCDADSDLTIDHITPVSKGGTNAIDNLQALCRKCNSSKKDRIQYV